MPKTEPAHVVTLPHWPFVLGIRVAEGRGLDAEGVVNDDDDNDTDTKVDEKEEEEEEEDNVLIDDEDVNVNVGLGATVVDTGPSPHRPNSG